VTQRDLFISHASEDSAAAQELRAELESAGYTCWLAPDDVVASRPWAEQILSAIESTRVMVVLISQHANNSVHVSREVNLALGRARVVLPIRIEPVAPGGSLEYLLSLVQRVDAFPPPISNHTARIRKMVDAVLESRSEGRSEDGATQGGSSARPGTDRVPTDQSTVPVGEARAAVVSAAKRTDSVAPAGDTSDPGPRAGPPITFRAALMVGAGALVLVGLATIGGFLLGGGAASSPAPLDPVAAGGTTPSAVVTASASPVAAASEVAAESGGAPESQEVPDVTPSPTPISPAASAKAQELMALIPEAAGYCGKPRETEGKAWVAGFICSSDAAPAAVSYYTYHLFPDAASMQEEYESWMRYYEVRADAAGPCADGVEEEAPWGSAPAAGEIGTRFLCGVRDGWPDIYWTNTTTNVLAEIQGSGGADLGELHSLWATRSLDPVSP